MANKKIVIEDDIVLTQSMLTPATENCIVCDQTEHDARSIVVFEFPGFGMECFTFPPGRKSVWTEQAEQFVKRGGVPRWLCGPCHHGTTA